MDWFKLSSNGILRGSLADSEPITQLVWIKLLALMSETHLRNGSFEYAQDKPYSLEYIALSCGVTKKQLEHCLKEYEKDINPETKEPRIKWDSKTLVITNWRRYQGKPARLLKPPLTEYQEKAITRTMARKYPDSAVTGIVNAQNDKQWEEIKKANGWKS